MWSHRPVTCIPTSTYLVSSFVPTSRSYCLHMWIRRAIAVVGMKYCLIAHTAVVVVHQYTAVYCVDGFSCMASKIISRVFPRRPLNDCSISRWRERNHSPSCWLTFWTALATGRMVVITFLGNSFSISTTCSFSSAISFSRRLSLISPNFIAISNESTGPTINSRYISIYISIGSLAEFSQS